MVYRFALMAPIHAVSKVQCNWYSSIEKLKIQRVTVSKQFLYPSKRVGRAINMGHFMICECVRFLSTRCEGSLDKQQHVSASNA